MEAAERKIIVKEFIEAIHESGLVLTEKHIAEYGLDFYTQQKRLLAEKYVSAYAVAKWKLLPGHPTLLTIKNMIKDGRISKNEYWYKGDTLNIMGFAIKRLRGES